MSWFAGEVANDGNASILLADNLEDGIGKIALGDRDVRFWDGGKGVPDSEVAGDGSEEGDDDDEES